MQNGKYEGKGVCINGKEGGGILELCRTEKTRGMGGGCEHRKRGKRVSGTVQNGNR